MDSPASSPLVRSAAASPATGGRFASGSALDDLPDFLEVGLDSETRYRRLLECYRRMMEEHERYDDERKYLHSQLQSEKSKRLAAEEAERLARTELRESDEARNRMKEEQRALLEARLEQQAKHFNQQLREHDQELANLREERDIAQEKGGRAKRLSEQLESAKKKLEEQQGLRRERDDLTRRLDEQHALKQSHGAGTDHLKEVLSRTREELDLVVGERDEGQRTIHELQQQLEASRGKQLATSEELEHLRREVDHCGAARWVGNLEDSGPGAQPRGLNDRSQNKQKEEYNELLDRLLKEKERASRAEERVTRAETSGQMKLIEVTQLNVQKTKDAAHIATLEERARQQASRIAELQAGAAAAGSASATASAAAPPPATDASLRELQAMLAQRERELQVHRWRGQAESDSLLAQETLMVSCFHELGLRYQKLSLQHNQLRQRLRFSRSDLTPEADSQPQVGKSITGSP